MRKKRAGDGQTAPTTSQGGDDKSAKLAFDLAYSNLQSISRAQRLYLTSLLLYLCLVWSWFFVGSREAIAVQVLGVTLRTGGIWTITPLVTTLLTLALIGSVNAAGPAWKKLRAEFTNVGVGVTESSVVFYDLDTDKNAFDYLTFLTLHPEGETRQERRRRFDLWHFLYPALYAASIYTTFRARTEAFGVAEAWHHLEFQAYSLACLALQLAFSLRPFYRALCRFLGLRMHTVND